MSITRKVLFKKKASADFTEEGTFIMWGSEYEEFESGPGNLTVALVELPDGTVTTLHPSWVKFVKEEITKAITEKEKVFVKLVGKYRDGGSIEYVDCDDNSYFMWNPTKQVYTNIIDCSKQRGPTINAELVEVDSFDF